MSTSTAPLLFVAAAFLALLGVLIRFFGISSLIAGYDPERVTDEEGLQRFVGTNALYVAALTLSVGVAESVAPAEWYWPAYVLAVVVLAVRMIRGARRYEN